MKKDDLIAPGHRTCAGCGPAIATRMMLRATGKNVVLCHSTGCMEVTTTQYPLTSWKVPWIHV
ncbi:MAG: pyruvate synthase subunit beta, partial [Candidatus Aenigmarchaeota archaeon]|nr:pyruvate synthase subunit beta [Candidatus Aenigmarchaeota archaeon]